MQKLKSFSLGFITNSSSVVSIILFDKLPGNLNKLKSEECLQKLKKQLIDNLYSFFTMSITDIPYSALREEYKNYTLEQVLYLMINEIISQIPKMIDNCKDIPEDLKYDFYVRPNFCCESDEVDDYDPSIESLAIRSIPEISYIIEKWIKECLNDEVFKVEVSSVLYG